MLIPTDCPQIELFVTNWGGQYKRKLVVLTGDHLDGSEYSCGFKQIQVNTKKCRRQLALDLCSRSPCYNKMAAVLSDGSIFSWGWNHAGDGLGMHAEAHAIKRANKKRLTSATITIAGVRRGKLITSFPCEDCLSLITKYRISTIEFLNRGEWTCLNLKAL